MRARSGFVRVRVCAQVGILFSEQTDQMGRTAVVVKDVYQGTPAASLGATARLARGFGRAR